MFVLFVVAFVAIGLAWVLRPRAMIRHNARVRYGAEVDPTDTRVLVHRVLAAIVLAVGVATMLSWVGPL